MPELLVKVDDALVGDGYRFLPRYSRASSLDDLIGESTKSLKAVTSLNPFTKHNSSSGYSFNLASED